MTPRPVPHEHLRVRDLLAVPFVCVRVPLYAIDRQWVQRLHERGGVRLVFDCALGTFDILAGHALDDEAITRYGMGRVRTALHRGPSTAVSTEPGPVRQVVTA